MYVNKIPSFSEYTQNDLFFVLLLDSLLSLISCVAGPIFMTLHARDFPENYRDYHISKKIKSLEQYSIGRILR